MKNQAQYTPPKWRHLPWKSGSASLIHHPRSQTTQLLNEWHTTTLSTTADMSSCQTENDSGAMLETLVIRNCGISCCSRFFHTLHSGTSSITLNTLVKEPEPVQQLLANVTPYSESHANTNQFSASLEFGAVMLFNFSSTSVWNGYTLMEQEMGCVDQEIILPYCGITLCPIMTALSKFKMLMCGQSRS